MKLFIVTNRNLYIHITKYTYKMTTNQYKKFFPILLPKCYSIVAYFPPLPLTDALYKSFIYVSAGQSTYFKVEGVLL